MLLLGVLFYSSTFLAKCGPAVDPQTTQAIIQVESGGNPFAIGDNTLKKSFSAKTAIEATALASQLLAQGHSIDMGLMQVNSCHLGPMKLTLEELFEPCSNVWIGTTILADFYRRHRTDDELQSLFMALSAYNTGRSWRGAGYINKILQAVGASYRVSPPTGPLPMAAAEKTNRRNAKDIAASSPLFFENLSSSMQADEL